MNKFDKYFIERSISYEGKTVAVTGATGSLGYYISRYVLFKGAKLIIVGRNEKKIQTTISELKKEFPNNEISSLKCDSSSIEETIQLAKNLEHFKIDYLFNNAGCYHLPVKIIDGHDITFTTNFISPIYLTNYLCDKLPNLTIVQTGSISYCFLKLNINDIESLKKGKTNRYGNSKRLLTLASLKIQEKYNNKIYLTHPGVSTTSLFSSSKGGFGKAFDKVIVPIMKVIFLKPAKAALSIALAPSFPYKKETLLGPRGLFQVWGYPKLHKLTYKKFNKKEKDNIDDIIFKNIIF